MSRSTAFETLAVSSAVSRTGSSFCCCSWVAIVAAQGSFQEICAARTRRLGAARTGALRRKGSPNKLRELSSELETPHCRLTASRRPRLRLLPSVLPAASSAFFFGHFFARSRRWGEASLDQCVITPHTTGHFSRRQRAKPWQQIFTFGSIGHQEQAALAYNAYVRRHDLGNQLNDVDANGKPLPTTFKRSSRFHGVSWHANRSECQWRAQYRDPRSTPAKTKTCHVGYYSDEEVAALAYNEAVIAAGLDHIRVMNRVDATGRPLPKDQ